MKKLLIKICCVLAAFLVTKLYAQSEFTSDIKAFGKQDSLHFPPQNAILFIGSSSFTKWTDVQAYFPKHTIINRGFGGSTLPDVTRYANEVIFKYNPKQIVIYCGDNDLASSDMVTPQVVLDRFKTLFSLIRSRYKTVPVAYVSIKPSPSRRRLMPAIKRANQLITDFLQQESNTSFIDIYTPMLLASGKTNGALYVGDSLHMNAGGYAIWQKKIEPFLK